MLAASFGAFASTGNAALLSSSRYLLALGRDRRVFPVLATVSRLGSPIWALLLSAGAIALSLFTLDVENVAKLASAFQLLLFAMANLSLIVLRESQLVSYDPGFRCPLYPGMQLFGFVTPFFLIAEMGHTAIVFSFGLVAAGVLWFLFYARERMTSSSSGAVYYVLARLVKLHQKAVQRLHESLEGGLEDDALDVELLAILGERGSREQTPFNEVMAQALVLEASAELQDQQLVEEVARLAAPHLDIHQGELTDHLQKARVIQLREQAMVLRHLTIAGLNRSQLVLVRHRYPESEEGLEAAGTIYLVSPDLDPGEHLRVLTHLALRIEREGFPKEWLAARSPHQLRETLLHRQRFLSFRLRTGEPTAELIGQHVRQLDLPETTLLAAIRRGHEVLFPRGDTLLAQDDRVTVVGPEEAIEALSARWLPGDEEFVSPGPSTLNSLEQGLRMYSEENR